LDSIISAKKYDIAYQRKFNYIHLVMKTITVSKARAKLYSLLDEAAHSHEPIQITGKRVNGILVSEQDWRSIEETVYLLSIPGMRESIREGLATPVEECGEEFEW
jgi:prevent-host-death family protein